MAAKKKVVLNVQSVIGMRGIMLAKYVVMCQDIRTNLVLEFNNKKSHQMVAFL